MSNDLPDRLLPPDPHHDQGPLGAHWDGRGTYFSIFSESAELIELCLFDAAGRHETRLEMPDCVDGVWRGYLPNVGPGQLYGYRAYGPYDPKHGLRFNPHKLLIDPYARRLAGEIRWHDALYGYRVGSPRGDLSFDRRDSAAYVPKGIVVHDRFDWAGDRPPRVPWSETVIYEAHLKGLTQRRDAFLEHDRGTFGALGHARNIEYLKHLGITAVELLPIHAFARDRYLVEQQLTNYWGYNTLAYFAPDNAYLSDGTLGQIKWAVRQLHAAGIEVILDVVYNHTCEGSELGPTLSFRGLDNQAYYRLLPDQPRHHINDTGCGNTVNFSHPAVIRMVMDSLRYWVQEFHIDGFRFDLGVTLGREPGGFDPGAGFFDALMQDPMLSRVKLISEPWDIGPGGYQIGNHPAGMSEWNGKFRDDIRRYWKGDAGLRPALSARLQGSAEMFDHHRRRPWAGINFITAHDGFTLEDLVSYNAKHNDANGEDNRDGSDHNDSSNWGVEGPTDDTAIVAQRDRLKRAMLATMMISHGTPMLLAGDEFGQTQHGNNNVYCQDNEIAWLDWSLLDGERGACLHDFVARLIALRREQPLLQGLYFQHAQLELAPGVRDVFWFDEDGKDLTEDDWNNPNARLLGLRRVGPAADDDTVEVVVALFNADGAAFRFELPPPMLDYRLLLDSNDPSSTELHAIDGSVELAGHSVMLLAARTERAALSSERRRAANQSLTDDEPDNTAADDGAEQAA
ncbi:glycogen debranching protein GlgX [Solimonas marina]|uniref:Glycogen debranching protein GlgX n=1 Tax=Solimonas marina TaxID=2714601 RepID=A0A970B6R8_9GAMM|nr:glycogen debranching protein GlgX [Solimonas marina]NKF23108.1 glycogen debranching protein GlgX [Solimonas marina]